MIKTIALTSALLAGFLTLGNAFGAAPKAAPKGPAMTEVARCNDGKVYSHATGEKRGACSGHGGVAAWSDGSPVKSGHSKTSYK